ncbi:hypothetical protein BXO87_01865 [Bacillus sp. GZB]|uniref:hypothetical protein n=1 Tax=Bacillus TaxID=1386 RepID=UPI00097676B1|nr:MULTISPECIES: hypothetical protein [Bacillus]MCZ4246874.1 hypothetical protein [Bacillus amyloliquefaciens]OMQ06776.1 hypothetical protein BXO87_01865 [Bacillus sp. GZB]
MNLNKKELEIKNLMENVFVPTLHGILQKANPRAYRQWGGNACRQTAIFGAAILRHLLPEYKWTVWDGDFSDIVKGRKVEYNHAWIHGVNKKERKGLLVDLSRLYHERLFLPVTQNKYPKKHPSYENMRLIRKKQMDIEECLNEIEYYTEKEGRELLTTIVTEMTLRDGSINRKANDIGLTNPPQ